MAEASKESAAAESQKENIVPLTCDKIAQTFLTRVHVSSGPQDEKCRQTFPPATDWVYCLLFTLYSFCVSQELTPELSSFDEFESDRTLSGFLQKTY